MTKYDIKQSGGDGVRVIGSVDWSPEDWDYQTNDATVERLLATVITIEFKGGSTMITGELRSKVDRIWDTMCPVASPTPFRSSSS